MSAELIKEIDELPNDLKEDLKHYVDFLKFKNENSNQDKKIQRKAGFLKGTFQMSEDFDEPLEDFKEYMY